MRIAICEDDIKQQDILFILIKKYFGSELIEIEKFNSGEEFLVSFYKSNNFDIIFMDIRMKKINGFEAINKIRDIDKFVKIIITTSLIEYAVIGYSLKVDDFLLKPLSENNLFKVLKRVIHEKSEEKLYIIENRNEIIRLHFDDILYIESFGRKLRVNSSKGTFEYYQNISVDEKNLLYAGFVRVHRAYIVNMKHIYRIKYNEIIMLNNQVIPVSRKKYQYVYNKFTDYVIEDKS